MCTVTIIRTGQPRGFRLACNRDELKTRPAARPPITRRVRAAGAAASGAELSVLLPIDPVSDGTWIAVNDAGLAMTLLNVNLPAAVQGPTPTSRRSRGLIIPSLMGCSSAAQAAEAVQRESAGAYPPYRLVIVDDALVVDVYSDGGMRSISRQAFTETPMLFTSSGLGDHLVEGPRRALFETWFASVASGDVAQLQDSFHRHAWPDRRHLSVCMERADARTVSYTVIETTADLATMRYVPDSPDRPAAPAELALRLIKPKRHIPDTCGATSARSIGMAPGEAEDGLGL